LRYFMSQEFQILDYDRKLQGIMRKAEKHLSTSNLSIIKKYDTEMATLGLKKSTRAKQISLIVSMSIRLGKNWKDVTKSDIDELIRNIIDDFGDNLGGETETTRDYKKSLKPFFRWFKLGIRDYREAGDPIELKSIRMKSVKDKIVREELLTEEDHKKLIEACSNNARDRAFLDVHYEAGTRPGEILSLKIKHVKFDKNGATIHVDGKTGPRPVRIISSVPNLAKWLEIHPFRDNSDAPLWILMDEDNYGQQLTYSGARALLQRRIHKAKINKHVNLKLFRHSEATRLSKHLPEYTMRLRHGWTKNSSMPARYVHLVNADVDEKIFEMYGITTKKEEEKLNLPKKCPICDIHNSPESEICYKCGRPLDLKKALELEDKSKEQGFMANRIAGKVLVQMLMTGKIPKISKTELDSLIKTLNL
ncbi:MAG: tyrosine-type recombinase/integrase, partial [Candidatus Paceibacterota bacterium]